MRDPVTSLQNQRVKDTIKLRDRRGREKQQRIIVDGVREIARAVDAELVWQEAFVCAELLDEDGRTVADRLFANGAELIPVTQQVFGKLAFGQRHEGVVAVAQTPQRTLPQLQLPSASNVAVLEGLEKPGNVGAIIRTADAAGVSAVILANPQTDLFNPNVIRASQGTVFTLPVAAAPSGEVIEWLRACEFHILAARVDAVNDYTAPDMQPPCAIVLGSEADGLSAAWHDADITATRLPMHGTADSLNVSVTAGVLFYEALRQREQAN